MTDTNKKDAHTSSKAHNESLLLRVRASVESGKVTMKPRWQFVLHALALALAIATVLVLGFMMMRSLFFFVHVSELDTLTQFGPRGYSVFIHHFPWPLLLLAVALATLAVWGVRQFQSGARFPGIVLLAMIVGLVGVLSFAEERIENHGRFSLHQPFQGGAPFGVRDNDARMPFPPGSGVCRCEVKDIGTSTIDGVDIDTKKAYKIIVNPDSPYANMLDIEKGDTIFVAGEADGDIIHAFGIHKRILGTFHF